MSQFNFKAIPAGSPIQNTSSGVASSGKYGFKPIPAAPIIPKKTLGQKVLDTGTTVNKFLGGEKLADYTGAKIAKASVPAGQKQFVEDTTTGKQALGSAVAVGSWMIPSKAISALGVTGAKSTFDAVRLAKEAALMGGLQMGATSVAEGNNVFSKETALETGKGVLIGGIAGKALGELGTAYVNKGLKNKAEVDFYNEAVERANLGPIPEAPSKEFFAVKDKVEAGAGRIFNKPSSPTLALPDNKPLGLPSPRTPRGSELPINKLPEGDTVIPLESPSVMAGRRALAPVNSITPDVVGEPLLVQRARKINSKDDFIKYEVGKATVQNENRAVAGFKMPAVKVPSEKELGKIWESVHKIEQQPMLNPIKDTIPMSRITRAPEKAIRQPKVKTIGTPEQPPIGAPTIKATPVKEQPTLNKEIPKSEVPPKGDVPPPNEEEYAKYERVLDKDPEFKPGTNKEKVAEFVKLMATTKMDDIIDAIYGVKGKELPERLPRSAAYQLVREQAHLLTPKQNIRLLNKEPLSKGGAELQSGQVRAGEVLTNPLDMVDRLKQGLVERTKELLTKNGVSRFLDDLECK